MDIKTGVFAIFTAAAAAFGFAGSVSAATVAGSSGGEFTGVSGANTCYNIFGLLPKCSGQEAAASGNTLTWPDQDTPYSWMTIDNTAFSQAAPIGNSVVQVGSLTWYNASSSSFYTPGEFNATAELDLEFTSPGAASGTENVSFTINNTSNPLGDTVTAFLLGAFDFDLSLPLDLGSGVSVTSFFAGISNGVGSLTGNVWYNPENSTSVLGIYANIAAVPLPAGGILLLTALGGLGVAARRRKA